MTKMPKAKAIPAWQEFVIAHGFRAAGSDLAFVTGQPIGAVARLRQTGACKPLPKSNSFAALFALWNGREPLDVEWPAPRKCPDRRGY